MSVMMRGQVLSKDGDRDDTTTIFCCLFIHQPLLQTKAEH